MRRVNRYSIKQLVMMPYSVPGEFKARREFTRGWLSGRALRARRQHRQMARFECRAELEAFELSSTADVLFLEEMLEAQERDYAERAREYEVAYAESCAPGSWKARRGGRVARSHEIEYEDYDYDTFAEDALGSMESIGSLEDPFLDEMFREDAADDLYDPWYYDDLGDFEDNTDDWYYSLERRRNGLDDVPEETWTCRECRGRDDFACSRPECDNYEPGTINPECDFDSLSDDDIDDEEDYFVGFGAYSFDPPNLPSLVEWHNRKRVA